MKTLTREQAIKRIRDIRRMNEVSHFYKSGTPTIKISRIEGAVLELMAIFGIKEEEL